MCLVRSSQTLKNICVSEDKIGMCPFRQCQGGRQRVKRPKRKWHQHHPRPTEEFATWILVLKHVGTMDHMDAFVMTHQHPVCVYQKDSKRSMSNGSVSKPCTLGEHQNSW